jgi:hypothetical protein
MNRKFFAAFFLLLSLISNAQIHEIGVFAGGSNFIGDVGPTDYIAPNKPAFGLLYKWNRSPRHTWRFSYMQTRLSSYDSDSDSPARNERDFRFKNDIKEFCAGLEFDFFDFDLHDSEQKFTPYVFAGLSYLRYESLYIQNDIYKKDDSRGTIAIPMIVGVKGRVFEHFVLGFEVGARNTFSDDLDGSKPKNSKYNDLKFGNLTSKDWYVFTGITLTYTFGDKPCFCAD